MKVSVVLVSSLCLLVCSSLARQVAAQTDVEIADAEFTDVLSPDQWDRVDSSVDRSLTWLARQQQADGSFPTIPQGQPAVTALCTLAFLAHGHTPGNGPYGQHLEKAVDFIISCQSPDGLVAQVHPESGRLARIQPVPSVACVYNHAIGSLALSEIFGLQRSGRADRLQSVIGKSLKFTLVKQYEPKERTLGFGGWRYFERDEKTDSDLSITGWQLMFLRSAQNAGFDVPKKPIDDAVGYVRRCYRPRFKTFNYLSTDRNMCSRAMAGAGVLALAHAGFHNSEEATQAGEWILRNDWLAATVVRLLVVMAVALLNRVSQDQRACRVLA